VPRLARSLWLLLSTAAGCSALLGIGDDPILVGDMGQITVTLSGSGGGRVRSTPAGIDCPGTCVAGFAAGTMVRLSATSNGGSTFSGWQSDCSGTAPCDLVADDDRNVGATFSDLSGGHNFVFITAEMYAASDFGGLDGADKKCMDSAAAAGLPGTYVAWLSTISVAAKDRIKAARGWVRTDGYPVVDTVADLIDGRMFMPIRLSARGVKVDALPSTGTKTTGDVVELHNCNDFTDPMGTISVGDPQGTTFGWTSIPLFDTSKCSDARPIYCFGIDRQAPLVPDKPPGRLAFLSATKWTIGGGPGMGDAICQLEATMAGKTGDFAALLATTTFTAASRFDASGAPWYRPDGIPVALPGDTPFAAELLAPLNVTLDGAYLVDGPVALGAAMATAVAFGNNCADWTTSSSGMFVTGAVATTRLFSGIFGTGPLTTPCGQTRLYCFQK